MLRRVRAGLAAGEDHWRSEGWRPIPADLGTSIRSDGTKQVTYFHHPLYYYYYYAKDRDSSDVYDQGVKSFGSDWYALRTVGEKFER